MSTIEKTAWTQSTVENTQWSSNVSIGTIDTYDSVGAYDSTDFYDGYDPTVSISIKQTIWS